MKLDYDARVLREFCQQHGIARLELFGSALREQEFRPDSDVDLLATIRADAQCGLFEWAAMQLELEKLFGRPVDLVSRTGLERSRNERRKRSILSHTVPLYAEG